MGFFDIFFKKRKNKANIVPEQNKIISVTSNEYAKVYLQNVTNKYMSYLDDYFAFDIETTGLSPSNDKIIEIGVVRFKNGVPYKRYGTLINSIEHISSRVSKINHITDEMINDAPSENDAFTEIVEFMTDALSGKTPVIAHNANFDMSFFKNTLERLGFSGNINYIDTLVVSKKKLDLTNHKQITVAQYFDIDIKNAHRALEDAEVCGLLFTKLSSLDDAVTAKNTRNNRKYKSDAVKKMYKKVDDPSDEIMGLCAMVQKIIRSAGLSTNEISFSQHQSITRCNIYYHNFFAFKFGGNISYMLVSEKTAKDKNLEYTPCSKSDLDHIDNLCNNYKDTYVRVKLESTHDIKNFSEYIISGYNKGYKWLQENREYLGDHLNIYLEHNTNISDDKIGYYIQKFDQIIGEKEQKAKLAELEKQRMIEEKALAKQKKKDEARIKKEQSISKRKNISNRKLQQLDDDGNLIAEYDMLQRAIDATGINSKSIRDAANGKQKHAGGFVWKYIYLEENETNDVA